MSFTGIRPLALRVAALAERVVSRTTVDEARYLVTTHACQSSEAFGVSRLRALLSSPGYCQRRVAAAGKDAGGAGSPPAQPETARSVPDGTESAVRSLPALWSCTQYWFVGFVLPCRLVVAVRGAVGLELAAPRLRAAAMSNSAMLVKVVRGSEETGS
jgi:hypothetical protein